jgi:hypothetical protein
MVDSNLPDPTDSTSPPLDRCMCAMLGVYAACCNALPFACSFTSMLPRANVLENGMIALKHRESERKVSGQRLLFVAKVHVSFPRFGEAIP